MRKTVSLFSFVLMMQILFAQNAPVAVNDTFSINKNNPTTFFITANDYDINGDPLAVSILSPPAHGTATVSGNNIFYTPSLNYVGTDSFTYTICDTTNLCDTALVFITINGNNNPPVATDDNYVVQQNVNTFLPVTSNDYDPDGDVLTISILTSPQHGNASVINATQVLYVPNNFYYGPDTFVYVLCDSHNLCDTAVVYIAVNGANNPPIAGDDTYTFGDSVNTVLLDVLTNDSDPENNSISISQVLDTDSLNDLGTLTTDGSHILFTRSTLACGTETFSYLVCDYQLCDTGHLTITINCPENVFLPEGFSPDGDGKNDKLVFTGLEYFSPASLKVFNRYGTTVYENNAYQNDWDGTALQSGKGLPDGTYYYVLELNDKRHYKNYLIINR